ncbi:E3 ubiquitin-protein ligase TRIM62-like isoform X2 [Colossoma macropomum]|uniref:E3 ubiquitin-protein ligase TRIM62-like isoform X2 n=1 Tax=Colossoma macropomum TaxID=42526 RepID=UPI00186520FC|nr:E3 ubiquitin-protein ligase TRIM62-like isoform X2 [Colossoma macropomum]
MTDRPESPSCKSTVSSRSHELPINFKEMEPLDNKRKVDRPKSSSCKSKVIGSSVERLIDFKGIKPLDDTRSESPSMMSLCTDTSASISGTKHEDDISVASVPSAADSGVVVKTGRSREIAKKFDRHEHRPFSRYAEAGDVACDLCQERKLKAYKSCMTCRASFCERHVMDHYKIPALQSHVLVEVTKNLSIILEDAQQMKIKEMQEKNQALMQENLALKDENSGLKEENKRLKQKICELRLPDYICKGKTPLAANVVWDPASAHYALILSDDLLNAQKFDKWECILATEGFSSGRHYWEVKVNSEFIIGVTSQAAQWKGKFIFYPSKGFWCLCHYRQSFTALDELTKCLRTETLPWVLGVCVDVDEKWVTFYNTETKAHIYTFRPMSFADQEQIYPIFSTLVKQEMA